jgi:hypothetical protein
MNELELKLRELFPLQDIKVLNKSDLSGTKYEIKFNQYTAANEIFGFIKTIPGFPEYRLVSRDYWGGN